MSKILLINIKKLYQIRDSDIQFVRGSEMKTLPCITNAFLIIKNNLIFDFGEMNTCPSFHENFQIIDCNNKMVLPSWCDSHSHIVFSGNRSLEFIDRIKGLSYEKIAENGGGILNSAKLLENTSEDNLFKQSHDRIEEIITSGTGAIEIKTGYGLNYDSERKMLNVIKRLKNKKSISIKSTFLGAHAFPQKFKNNKEGYLDLIINDMIPDFHSLGLIDFIDVFCEKGYFNLDQTKKILSFANMLEIESKIHVNQFNSLDGIKLAVEHKSRTVDHLEILTENDIKYLKNSSTMAVLLPTCSYFLGINYANARELIKNNIPIAIASDYNPGSSPSGNMNFVISTACIKMKLTTEEAINAATINGAYSMGVSDELGSITKNKIANLIITKEIESINEIPYNFGTSKIYKVILNGEIIN